MLPRFFFIRFLLFLILKNVFHVSLATFAFLEDDGDEHMEAGVPKNSLERNESKRKVKQTL